MTGGVNDLHVIMCYKTVGIDCMRKLPSDIQNKTRGKFNKNFTSVAIVFNPLKTMATLVNYTCKSL